MTDPFAEVAFGRVKRSPLSSRLAPESKLTAPLLTPPLSWDCSARKKSQEPDKQVTGHQKTGGSSHDRNGNDPIPHAR